MLNEAVCRQRPKLWPKFGSPILTGLEVTDRSVSSKLWGKQNSKLSLYCTLHYKADSVNVEQQTIAELHTTLFSTQRQCSTTNYRCIAHHIIQQTVPL